jgi:Uma2 family endonuclease
MKDETQIKEPEVVYEKHYTYRDYLQFTFDEMVEIIKGQLYRMSPAPSRSHQKISRNLTVIIHSYLVNSSCQMFAAPFDVVLPVKGKDYQDSDRVVQPDIVVICNTEIIQERGCFGVPDWIVEILSPHTTKKDLQDKFKLYEESGVKEYWVIEPRNQTVEVFVLEGERYQRITTYVEEDEAPSHTISGLVVKLDDVFAE